MVLLGSGAKSVKTAFERESSLVDGDNVREIKSTFLAGKILVGGRQLMARFGFRFFNRKLINLLLLLSIIAGLQCYYIVGERSQFSRRFHTCAGWG